MTTARYGKLSTMVMAAAVVGYSAAASVIEDVAISDEIRICVGSPIAVTTKPSEGEFSAKWYRGDIWGVFEATPIAAGESYTPTVDDNEKWLKCEVEDSQGTKMSAKVFCSTLPVVYVNTDDGKPIVDKTTDRPGTVFIQGNASFEKQYNGKMEIHGRGNSSWGFPKQKPYKIKLDKKTDIFGYGKNKHWVLLSNFLDNTCLRNVYGSQLAKELGVIGMDMQNVTLILNGAYQGVYLFGEHIRIDSNRINIKDWESVSEDAGHTAEDLSWIDEDLTQDVAGGYLWELSNEYDSESKFTTSAGIKIMFNRPEFARTSTRMMTECQSKWQAFEDAYRSVDGYNGTTNIADYADMDSMAKYMLVNVVLGNGDNMWKSRYAYLDAGAGCKITFGTVWDFDWGCGSVVVGNSSTGWKCYGNASNNQGFYLDWASHPWFCELFRKHYIAVARGWLVKKIEDGLATDIASLSLAGTANDLFRGDVMYGKYTLPGFTTDCSNFTTYLRRHSKISATINIKNELCGFML